MTGIACTARRPLRALAVAGLVSLGGMAPLPAWPATEVELLAQTIRFETAPFYPLPDSPYFAWFVGLDGVNGPDLLISGWPGTSMLLNDGRGRFGAPIPVKFAAGTMVLAVGDMDGDGVPDLVGREPGDTGAVLFLRRGLGGLAFAPPVEVPFREGPQAIAMGDVTGDHLPDLVVTSLGYFDDSLWVFPGDGAGGLLAPRAYRDGGNNALPQLADFNRDGALDIAVVCAWGDDTVRVLLNRGGGEFGEPVPVSATRGTYAFTVLDADADGVPDLALRTGTDYAPDRIEVARGRGDGTFAAPAAVVVLPSARGDSWALCASDLDGDGHIDLVATCDAGGYYDERAFCAVIRGQGNGAFEGARLYIVSNRPGQALVGDLDGDGALDLVATSGGHGSVESSPGFTVLRNRTDGTFAGQLEVGLSPGRPQRSFDDGALAAGHFRAGPRTDLVASDGFGTFVLLNLGRDRFSDPMEVGPGTLRTASDLDGDGLEDLFTASHDTTWTWRSRGDGQFTPLGEYVGATWLALADLDGDGHADMATRFTGGELAMRRGNAEGTFGPLVPLELWFRPDATAFALADVDGDGLADVVSALATRASACYGVALPAQDTLAVQVNLGAGRFASPVLCGMPGPEGCGCDCYRRPLEVAVADVDRDGRNDVVVLKGGGTGSDNSSSAVVLLGRGGLSFSPMPEFGAGNSGADLHVADLNLDGLPEILTVNANGGLTFHFVYHENVGGGDFLPSKGERIADFPTAMAVGDMDGDGLPDVVTWSPRWGGSLVVTRNASVTQLPTATLLSLVSADALPGTVSLIWAGGVAGGAFASLYRRAEGGPWSVLARHGPDAAGMYRFEDRSADAGTRYAYRLGIAGAVVETFTAETWIAVPARAAFALAGARPDPAPRTPVIEFSVPDSRTTMLEVFDVAGRRLRALRWEALPAGEHRARLDGALRPGLYLLRLVHGGEIRLGRMSVVD